MATNQLTGRGAIVDDDEDVRRSIARLLRTHGLEVETFASGEALLSSPVTGQFDWALVDVNMPALDGFQVAQILHDRSPAMRIVLMTGLDQPGNIDKALRIGAIRYILKPIKATELMTVLGLSL